MFILSAPVRIKSQQTSSVDSILAEMAFWGEDELCGRDKLPGYGHRGMACYYIGTLENRMALIFWTGLVVLGDAARIGRDQRDDIVAGSVLEFLVVLGTIGEFFLAVRGVDGW